MKSLVEVMAAALEDMGAACGVCTSRDIKTVAAREEHEGLGFLTLTLPRLGKEFERALALGALDDDAWLGFGRSRGLPRFLSGFLRQVFHSDGRLRSRPNVECIRAVRQITGLFGKMLLPCSDAREAAAMAAYVQVDMEVADFRPLEEDCDALAKLVVLAWSPVFDAVECGVQEGSLLPKHGPGATQDRRRGNQKWEPTCWTERLEAEASCLDFLFPNHGWWQEAQSVVLLPPDREPPVRVISVPKTQAAPRIIAVEPTHMQYAQQALLGAIRDAVANDEVALATWGFNDQMPNRRLARQGSVDGSVATLDLSEASDRVSWQLVQRLLRPWAGTLRFLDAARSRTADVPGQGVIHLAKFASMGSATCFPVEAMVFASIAVLGVLRAEGRPLTRSDVNWACSKVRVFGDDIIVPSTCAHTVMETLEAFGLRVNATKSFSQGMFRESCGADWYDGYDVSRIRLRQVPPDPSRKGKGRQFVEGVVGWVSFRNQAYHLGMDRLTALCDRFISRWHRVPVKPTGTSYLGLETVENLCADRWNPRLQRGEFFAVGLDQPLPDSRLDGPGALMKWFLTRGVEPLDQDHLRRAGRPRVAYIKRAWAVPTSSGAAADF